MFSLILQKVGWFPDPKGWFPTKSDMKSGEIVFGVETTAQKNRAETSQ
jgi:hypothetical protein